MDLPTQDPSNKSRIPDFPLATADDRNSHGPWTANLVFALGDVFGAKKNFSTLGFWETSWGQSQGSEPRPGAETRPGKFSEGGPVFVWLARKV